MVEYGSILDNGIVVVKDARIEFHPCRWAGICTYVHSYKLLQAHKYLLSMNDGTACEVEFYNMRSRTADKSDVLETSAAFRKAT